MQLYIFLKILFLLLPIIIVLIKDKEFRLYNPALILSIIYFFEFGLSSIYMIIDPSLLDNTDIGLEELNTGLVFIDLVIVFFLLGYYSSYFNPTIKNLTTVLCKKIPSLSAYELNIKNMPLLLLILLFVGWISRIILFSAGAYYHTEVDVNPIITIPKFKLISQIIGNGSIFPIVALNLCFVEWMKKKGINYLLSSLVMLAVEILYALPSGSKERIVFPVLLIIFLYSLKSKLPVLPLSTGIFFFVFFVFPFVSIYRSIYLTGNINIDIPKTFALYQDLFGGFNLNVLNGILTNLFAERLNYAHIVSVIVNYTPYVWDFKLGFTYLFFLISLIPRIFWPGKPDISFYMNDFGRDYGFLHPSDFTTSIDMTWVGEMFINFGWFGILVAFAYGWFYQIIYSYFCRFNKMTTLTAILYALLLYYMVRGGTFTIQFGGVIKTLFVIILIFYPFMRKKNKTRGKDISG
ncbi:MAG: hypothetical protein A3B68_07905 [Candidatus Melainabacteria bacterium RIFCSPHIGHO2_02_FULL_34_12]|nr:MAG: hypothetical protein A3B68_07905 [Candidatus Melainabacteria bacterium RIFCSPHIGHO2_02_FULL_34_12]